MTDEQLADLAQLDAKERSGQVLTGDERGRLSDLRYLCFEVKMREVIAGLFREITSKKTPARETRG